MRISNKVLNVAHDRTSGYCHICGQKVYFSNHGRIGARGAWEVDHSRPRARGGTDRASNLYAACLCCNRSKGTRGSRSARAAYGRSRAPLSRARRAEVQAGNTLLGGLLGAWAGAKLAGPAGAFVGGLLGGGLGSSHDPDWS